MNIEDYFLYYNKYLSDGGQNIFASCPDGHQYFFARANDAHSIYFFSCVICSNYKIIDQDTLDQIKIFVDGLNV